MTHTLLYISDRVLYQSKEHFSVIQITYCSHSTMVIIGRQDDRKVSKATEIKKQYECINNSYRMRHIFVFHSLLMVKIGL